MSLERILIIDDAEDTEHLLKMCMLSCWPDAIIEMYDPRCGMPESSFNWSRYDLLILDYDFGMKDENGLDWLVTLKQTDHVPPTIMLTGFATDKLAREAEKYGAEGFLDKAKLTPELFSNTVLNVLRNFMENEGRASNQPDTGERTQIMQPGEKQEMLKSISSQIGQTGNNNFERTEFIRPGEIDLNSDLEQTNGLQEPPTITQTNNYSTSHGGTTNTSSARKKSQSADIPFIVPGYQIEQKIGEGGMASIYLAHRDEDELKVVLKILSLEDSSDSKLLRRFMREYKLIAQIQHPNVVQIHERAFASTFAYIAMEYFEYGDLSNRLTRGLSAKEAIDYLHQIAEGLGAAHAQGIVHRDMKPANILFRSEDSLAVTDFGIAKMTDADQMMSKELTMDGELLGTLYYISPEQIMGGEADMRSDLYSLGVIMYKMLAGKYPYTGSTPEEVFNGHINSQIPLLPEEFSSLQQLLDGLLEKDPDERFQSTEDLLMGLNWKEWS